MKKEISNSQNFRLNRSYHRYPNWTESLRKITELTIASLMVSFFVRCHLKTLDQTMPLVIWWPGKMAKYSLSKKIMVWSMYTTWTPTYRDQSSTFLVQGQMIFWSSPLLLDTPSWSGPRTRMIQLAKVIMESIPFSTSGFIKVKIGKLLVCLITKFRMLNGLKTDHNLLWFQDSSLLRQLCTTLMASPLLNSESNSETLSKSVHLAPFLWSVVLETLQKVKWTSGT